MTIQRDVYVLKDVLKTPIEIAEGTDAVTLDFTCEISIFR